LKREEERQRSWGYNQHWKAYLKMTQERRSILVGNLISQNRSVLNVSQPQVT